MSFVKICGITTLEDANICINAGADALGFVFYKPSARYITPQKAQEIIKELPPFITKVGLFVNEQAATINKIAKFTKLSLIQLHFEASRELKESLEFPFLSVKRVKSPNDLKNFDEPYTLVDAFVDEYGGMGKSIDISWFDGVDCTKLILAGGLHVKRLSLLKKYKFYGYDVSSGVEKSKGIKDKQKVMNFIKEAKQ